ASSDGCLEPVEEGSLSGVDLLPPGRQVEPRDPVDLGELLHPARAGRPRHLEGVRGGLGWVEVALDGPAMDDLPARLADLAEREHGTVGALVPRLLLELAPRERLQAPVVGRCLAF